MVDIEQGSSGNADNIAFGGKHKNAEGYFLRWSRIHKSVKVKEDNSGLLRSHISKSSTSSSTPSSSSDVIAASTSKKKTILKNVSGAAYPGEILALMGPSGSGKTSLLDALSGRSAFEEGMLSVNGTEAKEAVMKKLKRKIAYVKQADIFFGHLTVRDQLTYTALLRLPSTTTRNEKHAEVSRILSMLRLDKCADTPIWLLSGGEKKRVNIGTELLTDPRVILLDEPTSGLDSTSAVALLKMLHTLAKENGKTIVTSIHQPSSAVFRAFDRLIMLAEGSVVYYGTPVDSLKYLRDMNMACPDGYNAADHWMDLLVVDSAIEDDEDDEKQNGFGSKNASQNNLLLLQSDASASTTTDNEEKKDDVTIQTKNNKQGTSRSHLIGAWDSDAFSDQVDQDIQKDADNNLTAETASLHSSLTSHNSESKYNVSWFTQFKVLVHRSMRNARSAIFTTMNLMKSMAIGLMMGLLWFQLPYTEKTVNDRVSYFFFTMTYWVFDAMFTALMSFPSERAIIFKERACGAYHLSAYFLAKSLSEAPTRLALPLIYMTISYWLAGINPSFYIFLGTTMCTLLSVMAGESIGLVIGASVMDQEKALVIMVVCSLTLMVLGGFFVENIPPFISWLKFLSPFKYAFDASQQMVFNENVPCDGSGVMEKCKGLDTGYVTPDEMLVYIGAQGSIGFNIGMLFLIFLIPRYIAYLCLRMKKSEERKF